MSNYTTYEERMEIEMCLFNGLSFSETAKEVKKDRSTISREVRKHSVIGTTPAHTEKAVLKYMFARGIVLASLENTAKPVAAAMTIVLISRNRSASIASRRRTSVTGALKGTGARWKKLCILPQKLRSRRRRKYPIPAKES